MNSGDATKNRPLIIFSNFRRQLEKCSNLRWVILVLACMMLFGNFYAFDIPASLNVQLEQYLGYPSDVYQYRLNLLYSGYSLPNIIVPCVIGTLVDKYGTAKLMVYMSIICTCGQLLFSFGAHLKLFSFMLFGRILFGIGSESLGVAQSRITAKWFKGKELAFALGINLSVARLGSVANDLMSPYFAKHFGLAAAVWFGFSACFLSFLCTVVLCFIDITMYGKTSDISIVDTEGIYMNDIRTSIDPLTEHATSSNLLISESSHGPLVDSIIPKYPEDKETTFQFKAVRFFPSMFWTLCLVTVLVYGTVIPFNTIHSAFLQVKWYPNDPVLASQIIGIPDTLAAVLVPFVGYFTDRFGMRVRILLFCSVLISLSHLSLGTLPISVLTSPIIPLLVLGFAYSLLLTIWSCIPLIINENHLATAFGIATSALNAGLFAFPIVVASLVVADKTYYTVEMFFALCAALGGIATIRIYKQDKYVNRGALEKPQIENIIV